MPDAPEPTMRLTDWRVILAGIKQFGLAPDGSDLRDLAAACERLEVKAAPEPTAEMREAAQVTLAECPVGLFEYAGELCLKTEYGNNEGRIDAYIVSSGEFFWGDPPQTIASQRAQLVTPVCLAAREATARADERAPMTDSPPVEVIIGILIISILLGYGLCWLIGGFKR